MFGIVNYFVYVCTFGSINLLYSLAWLLLIYFALRTTVNPTNLKIIVKKLVKSLVFRFVCLYICSTELFNYLII